MSIKYYLDSMSIVGISMPHVEPRKGRGEVLTEEEIEILLSQVVCAHPSVGCGYRNFPSMVVKSGPCYNNSGRSHAKTLFNPQSPDDEKLKGVSVVLSKTPSLIHATVVTPTINGAVVIHVHEKEQGLRLFPDDFPYQRELAYLYDEAISRSINIIDRCALLRGGDPRRIIPLVIEDCFASWGIAEELARGLIEERPELLRHPLMKGARGGLGEDFRLSGRLSVDILNTSDYLRAISRYLIEHPDYLRKLCIPPNGKIESTTRTIWYRYEMSDKDVEKYINENIIPGLSGTPVAIEPIKYMYGSREHGVLWKEIQDAYLAGELGFVGLHVPNGIPVITQKMRKTRDGIRPQRVIKPITDMGHGGAIYLGDIPGTEETLERLYDQDIFELPPSLNPGLQWLLVSGVPHLMREALDIVKSYKRPDKIDGEAVYSLVSGYIRQLVGIDPIQYLEV